MALFGVLVCALVITGVITYSIPAVVGILGFTSTGIAGGTVAAWMMSLCGGATAAGSVVAICQKIGATGSVGASITFLALLFGGIIGYSWFE